MTGARHPASAAQIAASSPGASTWVSANAGSGKTSVLTRRVARLLLEGCKPERILCLTYTRAAAAEMQSRLFKLLGEWSLQGDAKLAETLADLDDRADPQAPDQAAPDQALPDQEALRRARKLFAEALETPGGLKIQTIHAFCASLLRRFPLEAGAPPGFAELDDAARAGLLERLRDRLALEAEAAETAGRSAAAFDAAADRLSEAGLEGLTDAILHHRAWFPAHDPAPALRQAYGVSEGADLAAAAAREFSRTSPEDLSRLVEALSAGKSTDVKFAEALRPAMKALAEGDPVRAARALEGAGLTQKGEPRSLKTLPTKAVREANPWAEDQVAQIVSQAAELRALRLAHDGLAKSLDLHRYARALLDLYAQEKARLGVIDFDDLVRIAGRLLTTAEMAAWALWKLDGGLDHILIDEAQDTSPEQWRLIRALAEEFFAGAGARETPRTVFAVGDEKQSIYSFQGAEPREFGRMRAHFRDRLAAAEQAGEGQALRESTLAFSFRSAPSLLALVDESFADAAEGLSAGGPAPEHIAFRDDAPGRAELWPLLAPQEEEDPPAWHEPVDARPRLSPPLRLADALAAHVADQLDGGAIPDPGAPGGWRPLRPGDVMILLRRRGVLAGALVDRLKQRGVPVAGADRLRLMSSLAARDLMSLMRLALDPDDDLSAAEAMRSPLGMVSAQGLEDLALARGRLSLRRALAARAEADPGAGFDQAATLIEDVLRHADYERPYELLQRALIRHGGRARIRARLNPEEEDAADELLAQALAYERVETPTLAGFIAHMEAASDLQLKREMDAAGDAVRVMTVHASKGLEAPFVILADAGPVSAGGRGDAVLPWAPGGEGDDAGGGWDAGEVGDPVALWSVPDAEAAAPVQAAKAARKAKDEAESLRLLYVALTRARSRLLVCGTRPARGGEEGSWHDRVARALAARGAQEVPAPLCLEGEDFAEILRLDDLWAPPAEIGGPAPVSDPAPAFAPPPLPAIPLAPGPARPRRVSASALDREGEAVAPKAGPSSPPNAAPHISGGGQVSLDRRTARRRGDAIHVLLEELPLLPEAARPEAAARLLAAAHADLSEAIREGCAAEALAALAHPEIAPFLAPEALAEAPLTAALPGGLRLDGRIDRLLIAPDLIRLLDWKSGPAPAEAAATPESYLRQMAAYRHALGQIHPGAEVEACLFWTAAGRLDRLDAAALEAALARLSADPGPAADPAEDPDLQEGPPSPAG